MSLNELIVFLAEHSQSKDHELIEDCLNFYHLRGTKDLTYEQALSFIIDVLHFNKEDLI